RINDGLSRPHRHLNFFGPLIPISLSCKRAAWALAVECHNPTAWSIRRDRMPTHLNSASQPKPAQPSYRLAWCAAPKDAPTKRTLGPTILPPKFARTRVPDHALIG